MRRTSATGAGERTARRRPPRVAECPSGEQLILPHAADGSHPPQRCCGLDEVGRGALAGPLVAAAVMLPDDFVERLGTLAPFLRDSKTVPAARREEVAALVRLHAPLVEIAVISVAEINARGIGWANREVFRRLIERTSLRGETSSATDNAVDQAVDEYVVDGRVRPNVSRWHAARVRCLVRADSQVPAVSAASLVAKVYRDAVMRALHTNHPMYGWNTNVGYGTVAHVAALRASGPCAEHRDQFVRTALRHKS